jgi:L-histidine N-alpha-methyltransferase
VTVAEPAAHLEPTAFFAQLAEDVRVGLSATPKILPPKYFYDARGSELFDEITRLPEYYPTRTEAAILQQRAVDIAEASTADTLIELGSGTSEKTRVLLRALRECGSLHRFVPFDVDPAVLKDASASVADEFPDIDVQPIIGDFETQLATLPESPRRLIAFLGSTVGNFETDQRREFLAAVRAALGDGDAFLLGTDLVKSPDRLVAAYDDAQGITAAFNKNVLAVVNRELEADFEAAAFEHVALWDAERERIEMRLRSARDQRVHTDKLAMTVAFTRGEQMRTEISAKFRREVVTTELATAGLRMTSWWTDPAGDFALSLSVPD